MYKKLYHLQDKVFEILSKLTVQFYLTGGTALSRVYLQHRFSEDLDFFVNSSNTFKKQLDLIFLAFKDKKVNFKIGTHTEDFCTVFIEEDYTNLKLDFVNDIPIHFGKLNRAKLFPRIDNPLNILSNKISALPRHEPKDIADILFISKSYNFEWETIVNNAKAKDEWVNPIQISKIIDEFPLTQFKLIHWINPVDLEKVNKNLKIIAKAILFGEKNKKE